jgi:hypothetical protein
MSSDKKAPAKKLDDAKPTCGIIMPIGDIGDCRASHWKDVCNLIRASAAQAGFVAEIVSREDVAGVVQRAILKNIYQSDVVVCDVSMNNPNVMLELGMRLMFDKPTIIVKDDQTKYIFDTSPLYQVGYPRDLRHPAMVEFQDKLSAKIKAAHEGDEEHSFLKTFGTIQEVKLDSREVPESQYMMEMIKSLSSKISKIALNIDRDHGPFREPTRRERNKFPAVIGSPQDALLRLWGESRSEEHLRRGLEAAFTQMSDSEVVSAIDNIEESGHLDLWRIASDVWRRSQNDI